MSTVLTRFEVLLPQTVPGTAQDTAVNNFISSITGLVQVVYYNAYIYTAPGTETGQNIIYGLLTAAQQSTALGFLNTLNAALNAAGSPNVLCTVNQVTSGP